MQLRMDHNQTEVRDCARHCKQNKSQLGWSGYACNGLWNIWDWTVSL